MSEQFENSIRGRLQDPDLPFDPDAWEDMKRKLDQQDRRRPSFWWVWMLAFVGIGVGVWQWSQNDFNRNNGYVKENVSRESVQEKSIGQHPSVNNDATSSNDRRSHKKDIMLNRSGIVMPGNTVQANISGLNRPSAENEHVDVVKQNIIEQNSSASVDSNIVVMSSDDAGDNSLAKDPPRALQKTDTSSEKTRKYISVDGIDKKESIQDKNNVIERKTQPKRGFEGGITLGPDFNIPSSLRYGRMGFGGGFLLRYHFTNRWFLSTGAVYTKKIYGATPKDYNQPYPSIYTKVSADCNVLDVPLQVHYAFTPQLSLMAGASSYFMLKEKYEYYYEYGPSRKREFKNASNHYFSVVNLGITWEAQTRGRLKWALQPYAKIPLGGVGQGQVKLYSAGINLQLMLGKK